MATTKKDSPKINNGLKRLIQRFVAEDAKLARIDYGQAVVDYLAKPENGGYDVTRNHVYLIVNDHVRITPGNIHIAKAVKAVSENFVKELADLAV